MLHPTDSEHWSLLIVATLMSGQGLGNNCDVYQLMNACETETRLGIAKSMFDLSVWFLRARDISLAFNWYTPVITDLAECM